MTSKLNLVDLAGSERISRTESSKSSFKESMCNLICLTKAVNKSLAYLEQVIMALGDKARGHIPYRQSKLTHVLRDSLGGNCNTIMIANIWPKRENVEETISTLRFSSRMMAVIVNPEVNVRYDPAALAKKYEKEIKTLQLELSKVDLLANRPPFEPYTETERSDLMLKLKGYIEKETDEVEIVNIRMAKEALTLFRTMYKTLETEVKFKPSLASELQNRPIVSS